MYGAVLTADASTTDAGTIWGLTDRTGQITPATLTGADPGAFPWRPELGVPTLRVRSNPTMSVLDMQQAMERLRPVIGKLDQLARLPAGWNSYSARRIEASSIVNALTLLLRHLPLEARLPEVIPTVRGGLQLEWHTSRVDIEVYIPSQTVQPGEEISFFAADTMVAGEEFEGLLTGNEALLAKWVGRAR